MKSRTSEILLKVVWIGLTLFTIYIFGWLTFIYLTFGNLVTEKYTYFNLLIPNIITIGILILYSKELLIGYKLKSKRQNLKSLFIFSVLIALLCFIQVPFFKILFEDLKSEYWQIILPLIILLTSYVGIIMNRVLKISE